DRPRATARADKRCDVPCLRPQRGVQLGVEIVLELGVQDRARSAEYGGHDRRESDRQSYANGEPREARRPARPCHASTNRTHRRRRRVPGAEASRMTVRARTASATTSTTPPAASSHVVRTIARI